jgi:hypothetical protein
VKATEFVGREKREEDAIQPYYVAKYSVFDM